MRKKPPTDIKICYVFDIDGVITESGVNISTSQEEAQKRIRESKASNDICTFIRTLMIRPNGLNDYFICLTGRKYRDYGEITMALLEKEFKQAPNEIGFEIAFYPEHLDHSNEVYFKYKTQWLQDKLTNADIPLSKIKTFDILFYFDDDAKLIEHLEKNLSEFKGKFRLFLVR